ncbi:MAG: hypothetical protein ABF278_08985, partial [Wenyingzhuangia sp.]|uniref:hypothetical protein n=1 Tax=Wenyingzhuangia sp. TaxID=1964193 RepID=UPI00321A663F
LMAGCIAHFGLTQSVSELILAPMRFNGGTIVTTLRMGRLLLKKALGSETWAQGFLLALRL